MPPEILSVGIPENTIVRSFAVVATVLKGRNDLLTLNFHGDNFARSTYLGESPVLLDEVASWKDVKVAKDVVIEAQHSYPNFKQFNSVDQEKVEEIRKMMLQGKKD